MTNHYPSSSRLQQGVALIVVLLLLVIAIGMGIVAARMTLSGSKASRNDRDRQIAFQAAEMALNDAELDIIDINLTDKAVKGQGVTTGRACKLGNPKQAIALEVGCGKKSEGDRHGICILDTTDAGKPAYKMLDWTAAENSTDRKYVTFGEFTGRSDQFLTGKGILPAMKPRYIIVQSRIQPQIQINESQSFTVAAAYKVYALGFGSSKDTQVMLESEIYKPVIEKNCNS